MPIPRVGKSHTFFLFLIGGTIFLSICWYDNNLNVVEPGYFELWEKTYERVVIARLAKSQQDGIFSAGGLLGLANSPDGWNFDLDPQYVIYETGEKVAHYLPYKSHPGFQGFVVSTFDRLTNFRPQQNIGIIRITTTILSAFILSLLCALFAVEFGLLSAIFVLLFSAYSEWAILPANNSYWNLWAFYLPFLAGIILLADAAKRDGFLPAKVFITLFLATLSKILFTGFEMITTVLVMTTVPFVYFAIAGKWNWWVFIGRLINLGISLVLATTLGVFILAIQISFSENNFTNPVDYITNTIGRRSALNVGEYDLKSYDDSKNASVSDVISIYLHTNAFNSQTQPEFWQVSYLTLIVIFGIATVLFVSKHKPWDRSYIPSIGLALTVSTWYSLLAPLSWLVIFKPTSYTHTFLFPMGWQMPFTLLGFALCGFVITDMFKRRSV